MEPQQEKLHVFACPASRRALRQQNKRVMWCLKYIALLLDKDIKYSDQRKSGFLSSGTIFGEGVMDPTIPDFTVTANRSRLHNNEVVILISQEHGLSKVEFELLLKRSKPIPLV